MNRKTALGALLTGLVLLLALAAAAPAWADRPGRVLTGIDVLQRDGFEPLRGARVGLITNHTGIDGQGVSTIRRLHEAPGVELAALFSPEHGLHGRLDTAIIPDGEDTGTGLRIYSLYGETRRPTPAMLAGLDTLVFDIQDIGTRFYTYISTLGLAMQAADAAGLRFVVLDRPNPINGRDVAGPVTDAGAESFTAFHALPVRHGMTVGEVARLFRTELGLGLELEVIRLEGWSRSDYFDATGLRWVNPSPNMRSLAQALLYPGIGLLETTNLSVGRGTDTPFELFGAPWLDGDSFAYELNRLDLPGVAFVPVRFTPDASTFAGEDCGGVNVLVTDRARFEPLRTGLEIARQLRRHYPEDWQAEAYGRLLAHRATLEAVLAGAEPDAIEAAFAAGLAEFRRRRAGYLLYD